MMNLICLQFWLFELIWFTVSSALFIDCSYGNRNEQSRERQNEHEKSMRRAVRTNQSIRLSRCLPMVSRTKKNQPNREWLPQSDGVTVPDMRARKFKSPKSLRSFCWWSFTDSDETEQESEDDNDIDYDQVPSLVNSQTLPANIIQVVCSMFWTSLIQRRVIARWSRQKVWDW